MTMPAPRLLPVRSIPRLRTKHITRNPNFPNAQLARHSGRRGYASAAESAKEAGQKVKGSELPWVAGAVGATIGGVYLVTNGGKMGALYNHPMPGEGHHGEEHDEEHEGGEGGEGEESEGGGDGEGEASSSEDAENSGEGSEESSNSNADSDHTSSEKTDAGTEGTVVEELAEGEGEGEGGDEEGSKGVGVGKLADAKELEPGPQGQKRFLIPSAKGGNMRRIESAKGIVQGRAEGQTEGGSIGDVKDGSTSAVAGKTSGQQKGISNTDTKHSVDLMADPEKSKKSEGVPDSAKIQGTVDPSRKPS